MIHSDDAAGPAHALLGARAKGRRTYRVAHSGLPQTAAPAVKLPPASSLLHEDEGTTYVKIRDNLSSWVLWWRRLPMGAPQSPKPIEEEECVPRVPCSVEELREARKPEKKRVTAAAPPGPRRGRGLDNELEGERRRPRRKTRKQR